MRTTIYKSSNENGLEEIAIERDRDFFEYVRDVVKYRTFTFADGISESWVRPHRGGWRNKTTYEYAGSRKDLELSRIPLNLRVFGHL